LQDPNAEGGNGNGSWKQVAAAAEPPPRPTYDPPPRLRENAITTKFTPRPRVRPATAPAATEGVHPFFLDVAGVDILANPEMAAAASRVTRRGGGRRAREEEAGEGARARFWRGRRECEIPTAVDRLQTSSTACRHAATESWGTGPWRL
jgi:hypothetical protein